jgi:hypothetical protein
MFVSEEAAPSGVFVVSSDGRQKANDLLDRDLEASDDAGVAASRE